MARKAVLGWKTVAKNMQYIVRWKVGSCQEGCIRVEDSGKEGSSEVVGRRAVVKWKPVVRWWAGEL